LLRRTFFFGLAAAPSFSVAASRRRVPAPMADDRFQLKVRTPSEELDEAVYEGVFDTFSAVMPLKHDPPFSGALEITFATTGHDWLTGASNSDAANIPPAGWYVGGRPAAPDAPAPRFVKWQASHMKAVLKRSDGSSYWSADYLYDGGMELSGWVVKTPAQAATLIARRLSARFKADIGPRANS
jgi:hypothetical protein